MLIDRNILKKYCGGISKCAECMFCMSARGCQFRTERYGKNIFPEDNEWDEKDEDFAEYLY